ncbi:MAG: protein kinase, partial [Candidatus Bipolaricaulia bacterium]
SLCCPAGRGETQRGEPPLNPGRFNRRAVVLRGSLEGNDTRLKSLKPFVQGYVLLSNDNDLRRLHAPVGKRAILSGLDACTRLQQADAALDARSSIGPYRDRIIAFLLDRPRRQAVPKAFGDYEVVEELAAPGPLRTFLAQTPDGHDRILRVILCAGGMGDCEAKKNYLLREFASLEQLQSTDRVPRVHDRFSFQWTEEYWVVPIEPIRGQSLRRLHERSQSSESGGVALDESIRSVVCDAFRGLQEIHECGILHRGLTPDRVHLRAADGRVVFSDLLIARAAEGETVASTARDMDPGNIYWAPECFVGPEFAEHATDVYSLAASLTYWLTGNEPGPTAESRWPPSISEAYPAQLGSEVRLMLQRCLAEDSRDRPTVDEMIRVLSPECVAAPPPSPLPLEVGAVVDGYRVLEKLGSGGTADTWLADDQVSGRRWVLKVIRDPDLRERLARQEFDSLMELRSEYFPRVFAVKPAGHPYHLRIEYVEGDDLRSLLESRQGDIGFFERVSADLLAALEYLRTHALIHRDVSAANVLVPVSESEPVRLIDFGMATSEQDSRSSVGTRLYMPPEIERGEQGGVIEATCTAPPSCCSSC